jgi:hypothetical protein
MMYNMNTLLITEQTNLEDLQANMSHQVNHIIGPYLNDRMKVTGDMKVLFEKILAGFLELPHKLKVIFDR